MAQDADVRPSHPEARGLGAALRMGLGAAHFPLVFYTTCDRQYQPADLSRLLAGIDQVHLVSGFRKFAVAPWPLRWRHLPSWRETKANL